MCEPDRRLVLITRPEPGASLTAARVAERGYLPVLAPMLHIVPRAIGRLCRVQAALVTSGNAIPALDGLDRAVPVFAVGDATAARAVEAGFTAVASAGKDARALAALVARSVSPGAGTLLLASGAGQGTDLAAELRAAQFRVVRRVAYAARAATFLPEPACSALSHRRVRAALFFSAETARIFVRVLSLAPSTLACVEALVISDRTAAALSGLPWAGVRVASHPNQDELVALLP